MCMAKHSKKMEWVPSNLTGGFEFEFSSKKNNQFNQKISNSELD